MERMRSCVDVLTLEVTLGSPKHLWYIEKKANEHLTCEEYIACTSTGKYLIISAVDPTWKRRRSTTQWLVAGGRKRFTIRKTIPRKTHHKGLPPGNHGLTWKGIHHEYSAWRWILPPNSTATRCSRVKHNKCSLAHGTYVDKNELVITSGRGKTLCANGKPGLLPVAYLFVPNSHDKTGSTWRL